MNKPIKYYVSYSHETGFGSLEITLAVPITTHQQILDIQVFIAKEYKLGLVIVLFYKELGKR